MTLSLPALLVSCKRSVSAVETAHSAEDFHAQAACGDPVSYRPALYRALLVHAVGAPGSEAMSHAPPSWWRWMGRRAPEKDLAESHDAARHALNESLWSPVDAQPSAELVDFYLGDKALAEAKSSCRSVDTFALSGGFLSALGRETILFPWRPAAKGMQRIELSNFYEEDGTSWRWQDSCISLAIKTDAATATANDCVKVPLELAIVNP